MHVHCFVVFLNPSPSRGQSETAVLESSLEQTMAQSISSANVKQLRRAGQILKLDIISESRAGRQDGGVQQLVPERDERSGNRVPASGSECWHQRAEDLAKWSAAQYNWFHH